MQTTHDITLYHYDEESERWRRQYHRAHVFYSHQAAIDKGLNRADTAVIRIAGRQELPVSKGDRIMTERSGTDAPVKGKYLTVSGWRDNRRGGHPHYRLECE